MSGGYAWRQPDDDSADAAARAEAARKAASERYLSLHQSARAAQARAMAERLSVVELRVFTAVLAMTKDWSRLSDQVSLAQLGEVAGIGGTAKTQATRAGKAARRLAALGVITYEPEKGRGAMVRIGIERVVLGPRKEDNLRPTFAPEERQNAPAGAPESKTAFVESKTTSARKWDRRGDPTRRDPDLPDNSSSSAPPEVAEEEDEEPDPLTEACRLVAQRRLASRTGRPITDQRRWLTTVAANLHTERSGQDFRGLSAEAIADVLHPMPASLYAEAGARASPWAELPDGTVVPAGDRGG